MSKHTPGPWKVSRRFDIYQDNRGYCGYYVGSTRGNSDDLPENVKEQDEANARLIAAAPELLDALQWIAQNAADAVQVRTCAMQAISKATTNI